MLVLELVLGHEIDQEKLHNDGAEKATRTCVYPSAKAERTIRDRSVMESVSIDCLAEAQEPITIEFVWFEIVISVIVSAVGMKHDSRARRKVEAILERVRLECVALGRY